MSNGKSTLGLKSHVAPRTPQATQTRPRLTLEQLRVRYAWACVSGCDTEYTNLVKAAPALIVNNGLMQALAFWQSKGKPHHLALLKQLLGWLQERGFTAAPGYAAAMPALYGMPSSKFRRATDETLALLRWLRQLAAASTADAKH